MIESRVLVLSLAAAGMICLGGCQSQGTQDSAASTTSAATAAPVQHAKQAVAEKLGQYNRPGYFTQVDDGRLWVFAEGSKELAAFKEHGEPAKLVTRIGAGPNGMTVKAPSVEVINGYLAAKPGFFTQIDDGRLWVFAVGSKELASFKEHGEPAKLVTRIGAGPNGMTIKAPSVEVIDAYLAAK